jgi:DNA repair photolyase
MGLNKQKGNMYDFVTHTWNTVKGKCPHACSYCYMKQEKLNPVRFDEKELKTDLGSGNTIFVGSSCDMFAGDIPAQWIYKTINYCKNYDNTYLFQSKHPGRFYYYNFPEKVILGTTIETDRAGYNYKAPTVMDRIAEMKCYKEEGFDVMITIEPVIDFNLERFVKLIHSIKPNWVNIGADSKRHNLPEPSSEKVKALIAELEKFTVVKQKNNLKRLL